ncbi:DUF1080 domain-containing protein [Flavihumibacter stibioxidans]|uniref:Secreted glycosyl hydrolase n=1 Tax=Flavihumibacter stibioxidans TaxID=1834163 RepID=A0ABR7MDA2_9BACT|nr:DUF1080 domain-containing protein [Flavihumibacter stibioxidans]MBC6492809.1 secreted glycosyl hydrolase [Flavihumibacter stibioxidans]
MLRSRHLVLVCVTLFVSSILISCAEKKSGPNTLTEAEEEQGWELLFDGESTKGWHVYNEGAVPSVWVVKDGALVCDPEVEEGSRGDLVSDKSYTDFDFKFDWKISRAGNSGVFINVQEDTAYKTAWATGPEYQLLDNANVTDHNKNDSLRQAGCLYGMVPLKNNASPRPYTEWNEGRIVQQNGKITFWLNGVVSAEEDINSSRWKELVAASSLGKFPAFGKSTSGRLALQDWARGVSFRNLKIRELK